MTLTVKGTDVSLLCDPLVRSDHVKNYQKTMKGRISQDKSYTSGIMQSRSLKSDVRFMTLSSKAKDMKAMVNKTSTEDSQ